MPSYIFALILLSVVAFAAVTVWLLTAFNATLNPIMVIGVLVIAVGARLIIARTR